MSVFPVKVVMASTTYYFGAYKFNILVKLYVEISNL
nr:MAG TPA: putative inner membrane protein [Caudoviricetes sp.]